MFIRRSRVGSGGLVMAILIATVSAAVADPPAKTLPASSVTVVESVRGAAATQATATTHAATLQAVTSQPVDDKKQFEDLWADLQKEEPWSSRAILDFYDKPAASVAFLKLHLQPLKIDQKEMDDAFTAMASEDEKIWRPAFDKLSYFDPRLNKDIDALLTDVTDPLARSRLAAILTDCQADQWKGYDISIMKNGNWAYLSMRKGNSQSNYGFTSKVSELDRMKPQWQRADRALVLLQHIGTPDAIVILRDMAAGHPAAQPTKIAKAALQSLGETVKW